MPRSPSGLRGWWGGRCLLSPIHAVPVRSPSPKLTAGWPHGVGKVHDTRPAGLAGGPSPPRREAAGDRAVWPVALFGKEIAEGWDRRWLCHAGEQTGARPQRHGRPRKRECRTTALNRRWHNWRGGALVQTAPGCERGAEQIRQPRSPSGLQLRWRVRLIGIAGHV